MAKHYMLECYGDARVATKGHPSTRWLKGRRIRERLPDPLEYKVIDSGPMKSMFRGGAGLLMSEALVKALRKAGVDNLDVYNAVIRNPETGETWKNYKAVNIIGVIACADMEKSGTEAPAGSLINVPFEGLVIDEKKAGGPLMFRLAESVAGIVVHEKVEKALEKAGFDDLTFHEPEEWIG